MFNGYRISIGKDKIMEMGGSDGCITVKMYFMPLKCILKVKFMLYRFYYN